MRVQVDLTSASLEKNNKMQPHGSFFTFASLYFCLAPLMLRKVMAVLHEPFPSGLVSSKVDEAQVKVSCRGHAISSRKPFAASQIKLAPFCIAWLCHGIACVSFFFSRKAHNHAIPKTLHGNLLLLYSINHTCFVNMNWPFLNVIHSISVQYDFERKIKMLLNPSC